jgi:hypothetical protein
VTVPVLQQAFVASLDRRPMTAAAAARSPFTGNAQVQDWGGEWWEYDITTARMEQRNGQALAAFLTSLRGRIGVFLLEDPEMASSAMLGAPVVAGGGQSGRTLSTAGWNPNTIVRGAGEFVSLGSGAATLLPGQPWNTGARGSRCA